MACSPSPPVPVPPVRPYRSAKRERQARETRLAILAAATEMFRTRGYAGTTIAAVAAAAGVAIPTVEAAFGTKADLLKQSIDVAIAGDDDPVPVLQRPWAAKAQAGEGAADFLEDVAEALVEAQQRAGPLVLVAFEAARADPRLEPLAVQLKSQRAVTAGWIADGVAARAPLRPGMDRDEAVDVVWLLMDPALFRSLTEDRGWSFERYGEWFAASARELLTAERDGRG